MLFKRIRCGGAACMHCHNELNKRSALVYLFPILIVHWQDYKPDFFPACQRQQLQ